MKLKTFITASLLGTILEWYDFGVYVYLAPLISTLFFPTENKYLSLMLTYLLFAVGFLLRPLGGMVFGHFGDRYGRKATFIATILLMSVSTTLMGLLPTYAQAGLIAPLLLLILRLLQGLSIGGEVVGTLAFIFESVSEKKRGFYSTLIWVGSGMGLLLGSGIIALLSDILSQQQMQNWGWRLAFILGILTGVTSYFLRRHAEESKYFLELKRKQEALAFPLWQILKKHKFELFKLFIIFGPSAISFMLGFVFLPSYVAKFIHLPLSEVMTVNTIGLLLVTLLPPLVGLLSDKIGRKIIMLVALCGFIIFSLPLFFLISGGSLLQLFWGQLGFVVLCSAYGGSLMTFALEAVPTQLRFSMVAISYNLSYSLFGSTAPLVATFLIYKSGSHLFPAFYLLLMALIALPFVWTSKERYRLPLF